MSGSTRAIFVLVVVAAFLCAMSVDRGYALEFGARALYWNPGFKGDLKVDQGGITGTNINAKDDLGIDNKAFPSVEAYAGIGKHHVSLMYTQMDYSGSKTLSKTLVFQGKTFAANAFVESNLKIRMLDLEYQYDLLNLENILAGFSVGAIGRLKYLDGDVEMKSATPGSAFNLKETFRAPVPMVGLGAHLGLLANILEARAKIVGIGYGGSTFYDALADLSLTPFPFMDIHGGYRIMKLKVDNVSDVSVDTEFSGPFIGLTIGF